MDHFSSSLLNPLTDQPLDRAANARKNPDWIKKQLNHIKAQFLILNGNQIVTIHRTPLILSSTQYQTSSVLKNNQTQPLLLGLKHTDHSPVFLLNIVEEDEDFPSFRKELIETLNTSIIAETISNQAIESLSLRELAKEIKPELAAIYSYASLLSHWHASTNFCSQCGSHLKTIEGGSAQQCTNETCKRIDYPRINPAVIMRVTKGEKILLARQEHWPDTMYSILAGFVEVGETLEHAVQREVMEEVQIMVNNINYHSSQPWPFPNSMMLGYTAEAQSETFNLEQDDIHDAQWLSAEELKQKIAEGTVSTPYPLSISYRLINDWFKQQTGISLKQYRSTLKE